MIRNELVWPKGAELFLADSTANIRTKSSRDTYDTLLRILQKAYPGKRTCEFTEADLVAWCSAPPAAGTVKTRRKVVLAFFSWATWKGMVDRDPSIGLRRLVRPQAHGVKHHNWLTESQVAALVAACRDGSLTGDRDRLLIMLAVFTGLRRFELEQTRWGHVDLGTRTLSVFGKGEKPATLGLPARLHEALFEWRGVCAVGLDRPPAIDDPIFPRARTMGIGEQISIVQWEKALGRTGVYDVVRRRGALIGVPTLAPHDLRRTFADLMLEQCGDIHKVSRALRHSNVAVTEKYLEGSPRRAVDAGHGFDIAL